MNERINGTTDVVLIRENEDGNKDISILGQGIGRGQISSVSIGAPLVWKKVNQEWHTSTIREFLGEDEKSK